MKPLTKAKQKKPSALCAWFLYTNQHLVINHPDYSVSDGTEADRIKGVITPEYVVNVWIDAARAPKSMQYMQRNKKIQLGSFRMDKNNWIVDFNQNDYLTLDLSDIQYIADAATEWNKHIAMKKVQQQSSPKIAKQ